MTITKEELEAIRERLKTALAASFGAADATETLVKIALSAKDVPALLAHIDELSVEAACTELLKTKAERDAYRASVERSLEMINLRDGIINKLTRERDEALAALSMIRQHYTSHPSSFAAGITRAFFQKGKADE